MYCIIVTKPLVKDTMLEPGDKWAEVQESIISMAFATKAKAERWAWRHGGIEEHDAQLVARGGTREFDYLKRYGTFELRGTSQYPTRTRLLLVDLGARELPAEPAQKKSEADGYEWYAGQYRHADICECNQCRERRTREAEQLAQLNPPALVYGQARSETVTIRTDPAGLPECDNGDYPSPF